jgi:hypothetical protein
VGQDKKNGQKKKFKVKQKIKILLLNSVQSPIFWSLFMITFWVSINFPVGGYNNAENDIKKPQSAFWQNSIEYQIFFFFWRHFGPSFSILLFVFVCLGVLCVGDFLFLLSKLCTVLNFDFYYIIICTTFIFDGIIPPQLSRINQKKNC